MRIAGAKGDRGGVWFEGPLAMGMSVCLHARVAVRVLLQLREFEARDAQSLYDGARAVAWRDWLTGKSTLSVHASVRDTPALTHSGFAALKVKDAVVDALRDALGGAARRRHQVARRRHRAAPGGGAGRRCSWTWPGEALHRRGYRVAMVEAPLKETLAAAVLALGGARPDLPFIDPMAGSGTLAIEHALAARGIAPGLRRRFGFERWPRAARRRARRLARHARRGRGRRIAALRRPLPPIVCADVDPDALAAAQPERRPPPPSTTPSPSSAPTSRRWSGAGRSARWSTNPPYGERLAPPTLDKLYRDMARAFERLGGWRVVVLSGNPLRERLRRKPAVSHRLWNGALEIRLLRYDIIALRVRLESALCA